MLTTSLFALFAFVGMTNDSPLSGYNEAPVATAASTATPTEPPVAPIMSWGDYDGDGLPDVYAIYVDGEDRLFRNSGNGSFADVTVAAGLSGNLASRSAQWADYDRDGFLDLYVAGNRAERRLFRNRGTGAFDDMTRAVGLEVLGEELAAAWLDYDGDAYPDLTIRTSLGDRLLHNTSEGWFEAVQLGLPVALPSELGLTGGEGEEQGREGAGNPSNTPVSSGDQNAGKRETDLDTRAEPPMRLTAPVPHPWSPGPPAGASGIPLDGGLNPPINVCLPSVRDQNDLLGPCLEASSAPDMGKLFPISTKLFVSSAATGFVGIGTTSPTARLHVEGKGLMKDTLTLNPTLTDPDKALDVSTGSIYKGGALFIHTKGGGSNTGLGQNALGSVTSGIRNTASGYGALSSNTSGYNNTADGALALRANTGGRFNTASGFVALFFNTGGESNTAIGHQALYSNTVGSANTAAGLDASLFNTTGSFNTAIGRGALSSNTSGQRNIALGNSAGSSLTGNDNIAIGNPGVAAESATIRIGTAATHTRAFVAGIRGVTTGVANAIPVLIDSNGQLGTTSSSRRFKKDIADMGNLTERLLELRPVVFHYKQEQRMPGSSETPLEYGLIAEEVADVFPDLVVYDEEGLPFTVKYHLLSAMLLNELKRVHERIEKWDGTRALELEELRHEYDARLAALESRTAPAIAPASVPVSGR